MSRHISGGAVDRVGRHPSKPVYMKGEKISHSKAKQKLLLTTLYMTSEKSLFLETAQIRIKNRKIHEVDMHEEWEEIAVEMMQIKSGNTLETVCIEYRETHVSEWCA
jgi:hypothetical protein